MPVTTLDPGKFQKIQYGPVQRSHLEIDIKAERPINIYTIPQSELEKWRSKTDFIGSSFLHRKRLGMAYNFGPEFEDDWYLILENVSNDSVRVNYEVSER